MFTINMEYTAYFTLHFIKKSRKNGRSFNSNVLSFRGISRTWFLVSLEALRNTFVAHFDVAKTVSIFICWSFLMSVPSSFTKDTKLNEEKPVQIFPAREMLIDTHQRKSRQNGADAKRRNSSRKSEELQYGILGFPEG